MNNPKALAVWPKSKDFVKEVYSATKKFPKEELFGVLCSGGGGCV